MLSKEVLFAEVIRTTFVKDHRSSLPSNSPASMNMPIDESQAEKALSTMESQSTQRPPSTAASQPTQTGDEDLTAIDGDLAGWLTVVGWQVLLQ
jgi:hypothetical protein